MLTPDKPHVLALLVGLAIAGAALAQFAPPLRAQEGTRLDAAGQKQWAAVAPGRVEASSREIKIGAPVVGRIAQVLVKANDRVFAGEVLIRLDDAEALARLAVAEAAVAAR
ncbi:MAG: biotin/lipoyl-binding protein, partial [Rhodoplanes sp.]